LAEARPTKYQVEVATTALKLGGILVRLRAFESAHGFYSEALATLQQLAQNSPEKYSPAMAVAHDCLGDVLKGLHRTDAARTHYQQALAKDI
jgi:predicted negative regulator of RcsB-dependent stress response